MNNSSGLALARRNRDMNRMLQIAWACVFVLGLRTGCRPYRTLEFVAVQHPVKFENWRIYVITLIHATQPI